tara:strand:+ start:597 stop:809 length:213 start_codon:yes stop_codon:yes gene_type:complete
MPANNRNKQYIIDQIMKRRGEDLEGEDLVQAEDELRAKKLLELHEILSDLRENPPQREEERSFIGRLLGF